MQRHPFSLYFKLNAKKMKIIVTWIKKKVSTLLTSAFDEFKHSESFTDNTHASLRLTCPLLKDWYNSVPYVCAMCTSSLWMYNFIKV